VLAEVAVWKRTDLLQPVVDCNDLSPLYGEISMIIRPSLFAALALTAAAAFTVPAIASSPAAPAASQPAATGAITKEQAIEMALKAHPGEVTKAYEDGHKGKQTWEVKIKGQDGKSWKTYYEISTGALVDDKEDK